MFCLHGVFCRRFYLKARHARKLKTHQLGIIDTEAYISPSDSFFNKMFDCFNQTGNFDSSLTLFAGLYAQISDATTELVYILKLSILILFGKCEKCKIWIFGDLESALTI